MRSLVDGTISATVFSNRMDTKQNDMSVLRAELLELKNVAYPTYAVSISLLDMGLQEYIRALGYAHDLLFNMTSQSIEQGTSYVNQSRNALPQA